MSEHVTASAWRNAKGSEICRKLLLVMPPLRIVPELGELKVSWGEKGDPVTT